MQYVVQTVDDGELPEGVDHVVVERCGGLAPILFVSGAPARCWRFMEDYRAEMGTGVFGGAQVAWPAERLLRAV